jgi:hypothetical protein
MKSKEEIEQLATKHANLKPNFDRAEEEYYNSGAINAYESFIKGYTQCQEDMADKKLSDEVLFEQATVAMEAHYGYGCETEIDAYFRGLKWMQKQFNKQD